MKPYLTTVELEKETMKFSAGHTTIFSATKREPLHGHMYRVYLGLTTWVVHNGMNFDYRYYKERINKLCRSLNQIFLMPKFSPYLKHTEDAEYDYFEFNGKTMPFLKEDVKILPVSNITVEELSRYLVEELTADRAELDSHLIERVEIKVSSAPGQSGNYVWLRDTPVFLPTDARHASFEQQGL